MNIKKQQWIIAKLGMAKIVGETKDLYFIEPNKWHPLLLLITLIVAIFSFFIEGVKGFKEAFTIVYKEH